tara:strand:- start:1245 stop:1817 length:573 start_codon:yes stop_codon:yes gene_type:complete
MRLFRAVFRNTLFLSLAFTIQACSSDHLTSAIYLKNGLSLKLPISWKVIDDIGVPDYIRTLSVLSEHGDTLTIEIHPRGPHSALLIPQLAEYFKFFVLDKIPTKRMKDSARITHGTSERSSGEGLYAELIVPEPDPLHVFIETMRAEYKDFVVYFTFSSQSPALRYSNKVDLIIEGFEIKKVSSYSDRSK